MEPKRVGPGCWRSRFGTPGEDVVAVARGCLIWQLDHVLDREDSRLRLILRAVEAAGVLAQADPETAPDAAAALTDLARRLGKETLTQVGMLHELQVALFPEEFGVPPHAKGLVPDPNGPRRCGRDRLAVFVADMMARRERKRGAG